MHIIMPSMFRICWCMIILSLTIKSLNAFNSSTSGSDHTIILQFDGSFRPPRDTGFPTLPVKLATCSASIYGKPIQLLTVGSRFLSIPIGMTSAQAEYEGLLLGLEWLAKNSEKIHHYEQLVIQGDCKTVIDQLNGKSIPRKLQHLYAKSQDLISQLSAVFDKMDYEHIPRTSNVLPDNLCGNLMLLAASASYQNCCRDIGNSNIELVHVLERYIQSSSSRIRYSSRPALYAKFWSIAKDRQDFPAMVELGKLLVSESRYYISSKKMECMANGVSYQIDGMRGLGQEKQAKALERKHRVLLRKKSIDASSTNDCSESESEDLIVADWDPNIPEEWNSVLNQWSDQISSCTFSWKEGSTIWCEENDMIGEIDA